MSGKRCAVMLFIRGLPNTITRRELKSYLGTKLGDLGSSRFACQGAIGACDIIRITDRDTDEVEYHALVEIQPAKLAMETLRELNGARMGGRSLEVRRYHHRSLLRDRRKDELVAEPAESSNRRACDRRRDDLRVELVAWSENKLLPTLRRIFQPRRAIGSY